LKAVSVIVPVFNVEKYLARCLDSLVKQTISDYEILIVNDGSTDGSVEIMKDYEIKYKDLIKVYSKKNGGLGSARNYGLQYAKGEYIGFIDSDDYVMPVMFEKMYHKAKVEDADLVICDINIVDDSGNFICKTDITSYENICISAKAYAHKYGRTNAFNKLYRSDLFFKTGIRYPSGWFEDIPVTALAIEKANKIVYVNEPLMYYVQRRGSIMNQSVSEKFSEKNFNIFNVFRILIEKKAEFSEESYNIIINELIPIHSFLRFYLTILSQGNIKERNKLVRRWSKNLSELSPFWYKSPSIQKIMRKSNTFKKFFFIVIINAFRTGNLIFLNILLILGGRVFIKKLWNKNIG